jgi:hypothetical protein
VLRLVLLFSLAATSAADAQIGLPAGVAQLSPVTASGSYVGPGDLVAGAMAWYGLRAYNAAYAAAGGNAATIRRASDNTTTTIAVLANGQLNTAAATSFCSATTCYVTELFDQSGHGLNATQSATNSQPGFLTSCVGGEPCMTFNGSSQMLNYTSPVVSAPVTVVAVSIRTGSFTSFGTITQENAHSFTNFRFQTTANTVEFATLLGGTLGEITATETDNIYHSLIGVFNGSSPNSLLAVDGTATSGSMPSGLIFGGGATGIGEDPGTGNFLTGQITELGIWGLAFSTAQQAAVCANQSSFYSLGLAC